MIIKMSDIKALTSRATDRTTEIKHELLEFLMSPANSGARVLVVVKNHTMVKDYHCSLSKLDDLGDFHITITSPYIRNNQNRKSVYFITEDDLKERRCTLTGMRFDEVYFDTPESMLFDHDWMIELMARTR